MADDSNVNEAPTRRDYIKYGGAVVGGGLFAGCTGQSDSGSTSTPEDESYSVTMAPVDEVTFESVPERWIAGFGMDADIGVALGQAEGLVDMLSWSGYTGFYDELPGVSVDTDDWGYLITDEGNVDKERFYELDPDLITVDPNRLWNFDHDDIEEIMQNIAPFLGNASRRTRGEDFYEGAWPDGHPYRYYSIREQLEIYGQAFQQQERASAMAEVHRETIESVRSRLPPESERPSIGLIHPTWPDPQNGSFAVYNPISETERTYGKKQYRDLGVRDAFGGVYDGESSIKTDYEGLLNHDPDAFVFHFGVLNQEETPSTIEAMKSDSIGSELTAVQNDRLYLGGTAYQGPIINLFQTEMLAKQLYPEEFGEWHGLGETPEDEQLFDRQRVADIVNGDI